MGKKTKYFYIEPWEKTRAVGKKTRAVGKYLKYLEKVFHFQVNFLEGRSPCGLPLPTFCHQTR